MLALATASIPLSGCDRQKGAEPQDKQAATPAASGPVRYQIVRDMAGTALPTPAVVGPDGQSTTLASLSGQPVVLNLWATWCAPCIEELPTLDALANATAGRAHVIALSQDIGDDAAGPRTFLSQRNWRAIASWHDPENAVGLLYGGSLPTTILFNASGQETARVIGPLDWAGPVATDLLREAGIDPR